MLIPIQPSPYDVWASAEIVQLVREAQQFKENLKVAFVVNRKIANTAIGRDVASALAEFDVPVLPIALHQRVLYAESAAQGLAVFEAAPNSDAAREICALVESIENNGGPPHEDRCFQQAEDDGWGNSVIAGLVTSALRRTDAAKGGADEAFHDRRSGRSAQAGQDRMRPEGLKMADMLREMLETRFPAKS